MARISKTRFKNIVNDVVKKFGRNYKFKKQVKEDALKWYEDVEKLPGYLKSIVFPESYITSIVYEITEKYDP